MLNVSNEAEYNFDKNYLYLMKLADKNVKCYLYEIIMALMRCSKLLYYKGRKPVSVYIVLLCNLFM